MDALYFDNQEYFAQRMLDLEATSQPIPNAEKPAEYEAPDTSICVRIRPLMDSEIKKKHVKGILTDNSQVVNLHEPRRRVNSKPDLNSSSFTLHQVYGPDQSTKTIYVDRVRELVTWVQGGGMSMLLAYGQTGSGKTFTVTEIERLVVRKLTSGPETGKWNIFVSIFEVAGNNMFDLLQNRAPLKVLEDSFGTMQLPGIKEENPSTSTEFLHIIETAKDLRSTEATSKNDQSSRSHAICRIRVSSKSSPDSPEGTFLLVDLAGSEASSDTMHHSAARMAETREINKSLTVLKDCIRARALWSISRLDLHQNPAKAKNSSHIPYRATKLTQVLKTAFDVNSTQTCKTLVIACVSPSILDTGHSKNTLRYAEMLKVAVPKARPRGFDERVPVTWKNEDVRRWIRENSGNPTINPALLAPKEDGMAFCRLKEDEFVGRALLTPDVQPEKAKLLYFKLWALHIDSRSLPITPAEEAVPAKTSIKKVTKQRTVNPGMFFRLDEYLREDEVKIVMVMAPEPKKSAKEEPGYICAAVRPASKESESYELFVADQRIIKVPALGEEVFLKYDTKSRYYYIS